MLIQLQLTNKYSRCRRQVAVEFEFPTVGRRWLRYSRHDTSLRIPPDDFDQLAGV